MKQALTAFALILMLSACGANSNPSTDSVAKTIEKQDASGKQTDSAQGSSSQPEKAVYRKITSEEAKQMIDSQEVIIVDVRTEAEYKSGHLPNAILLPNESIGREEPEELPDKEATILLYCRSGNRSGQAAHKLIELGYRNIYDFGGIGDWKYEIVTE